MASEQLIEPLSFFVAYQLLTDYYLYRSEYFMPTLLTSLGKDAE